MTKKIMNNVIIVLMIVFALFVIQTMTSNIYAVDIVQQGMFQDTEGGTCIVFRTSVKAAPGTVSAYTKITKGEYNVWVNRELPVIDTNTTYKAPYLYFTTAPVAEYKDVASNPEKPLSGRADEYKSEGNFEKSMYYSTLTDFKTLDDTIDVGDWYNSITTKKTWLNAIIVREDWENDIIANEAAENRSLPYIYRDSQRLLVFINRY